jgi:glycosyltransferase involved in cell wall biosynthesis
VLFEAITLKKNIIATDVSGVSEMLEQGKLGLMIENSEDGIYRGMKQALTQTDSFEKYQKELLGYKMPFNLENSVQEIMKIIDGM